MATLKELKEKYVFKDAEWYKVDGILTIKDVEAINSSPRKTILVIDSTKGLSSELVSKFNSDTVYFNVVGGLDYFNKKKYRNEHYIQRNMMSVEGLTQVIKYYESIEADMSPEWSETQKSMYLYNAIACDFSYEDNYRTEINNGVAPRGLNGIMYKKLVCSGFAIVFKEGLDRINIENIYQNKKNKHSWNVVKLDGQYRGMDVTWDCTGKVNGRCRFKHFGYDDDFYSHQYHKLSWSEPKVDEFGFVDFDAPSDEEQVVFEPEETIVHIVPFTKEELKKCYDAIASALEMRKNNSVLSFNTKQEEIAMLPIDKVQYRYGEDSLDEHNYYVLYNFLKNNNVNGLNNYDFLFYREVFNSDIIPYVKDYSLNLINGSDIGLDSLKNSSFDLDGSFNLPFGIRAIRPWAEEVNIENQDKVNELFEQLTTRLNLHTRKLLLSWFNQVNDILKKYIQLHELDIKKDNNLYMVETDLYTKLYTLTESKDFLLSCGVSSYAVDQSLKPIFEYFEKDKQKYKMTDLEKKEHNIDYLITTLFNNQEAVRLDCEKYEGHPISDEEWLQKKSDADYMLNVYIALGMDFNRDEVQEALNRVNNIDVSNSFRV